MRKALLLAAIIAASPATSAPVVTFRPVAVRPAVAVRAVSPKAAIPTKPIKPASVSNSVKSRSVGQPVNRVRSGMFTLPFFKPSDFCGEQPRRLKDGECK